MKRRARVLQNGRQTGILEQTVAGYRFVYDTEFLAEPTAKAVSLTLPLQRAPYESVALFPFFVGLLAEGQLKEMQCRFYKIDPNDDFTRLVKTTADDVIGAITVEELPE
jgi:serine/threonine-protein kinase HipA